MEGSPDDRSNRWLIATRMYAAIVALIVSTFESFDRTLKYNVGNESCCGLMNSAKQAMQRYDLILLIK